MNSSQPATHSLRPFQPAGKTWSRRDAAHLLRRTQFGVTHDEIETALELGPKQTIDRLLTVQEEPSSFQTVDTMLRKAAIQTNNINDLKAWWLYRMQYSANPLAEKMTLFWHNHFATSNTKVRSVAHMLAQNELMRRHALGGFDAMLTGMASDVAMLVWLDGSANQKRAPNENFAREVMELFSLGVGNYTEQDIKEAARAFTGWSVRQDKFWFNKIQHDYGQKRVFGKAGAFDGGDIIKLCLEQPACPRFLAAKLLRFFVMPEPKPADVDALAARIREHRFDMAPVMRELLSSELFFSPAVRSTIIKSPTDFVIGSYRALGVRPNLDPTIRLLARLGQDVFEPPTVKGWEGGRLWINSAMLLERVNFIARLTSSNEFGATEDLAAALDRRQLNDAGARVQYLLDLCLAVEVSPNVKQELASYLTGSGGNREERTKSLAHLIMTMPEYQLV